MTRDPSTRPAWALTGGRSGRRAPRQGPRRLAALAATIVAVTLVALFVAARRRAAVHPAGASFAAGAESLAAATGRRDWAAAEQWAERLAREQPRNYSVIYELALSLHNHAGAQAPGATRPRPALRTSLDRIAAERRVMALLDSAAALARSPEDWARAEFLHGLAYENLGLPLDAYERYRAVRDSVPGFANAEARYRWLRVHLANPLLPDTASAEARAAGAP